MKQVFTDERFPGFEIHNEGTNTFHVYQIAPDGQSQEVDTFSTFSDHPTYRVSPETIKKQALGYFERMASRQAESEDADQAMHSQEPLPEFGKSVSLNDLMGGKVMTSDDVMFAYDRARVMTDPGQREKALDQVRQMSSRLESTAHEIVRRLID